MSVGISRHPPVRVEKAAEESSENGLEEDEPLEFSWKPYSAGSFALRFRLSGEGAHRFQRIKNIGQEKTTMKSYMTRTPHGG